MSVAAETLNRGIRRVILSQAILTVVVAGIFLLWHVVGQAAAAGIFNGLSALYGGAVAVFGTWWLGRSVQRAGEKARQDAEAGKIALYLGAAQRFVATLVLLGVGFGALKLAPLPLIIAFAIAQLGFFINTGGVKAPPA